MSLRQNLGRRFKQLMKSNTSPREIALGVAIGVFIGITPLYGFHTLMVICAAFLVPWANKIAIFLGTSINTTLTFPFITWSGYNIGRKVLGGYPSLTVETFKQFSYGGLLHLYIPLLIGSIILGLVLGLIAYAVTIIVIKMKRKETLSLKTLCAAAVIVLLPVFCRAEQPVSALGPDVPLESITYAISPVGWSEYRDEGLVTFEGAQVNLVTLFTKVAGFSDREKIYSNPYSHLPVRVEREVNFLFRKERIIEQYDPIAHSLIITKFIGGRKVKTYEYQGDGAFHNAVTLPFYLRSVPGLFIGWNFKVRIPQEFDVTLVSIDDIKVPAGQFKAYHFVSNPDKFHIWISADPDRTPLKITGLGGRSFVMKKRQEKG
ncbi:MAG: DUF2062 domain-containing protein [Deltaproteobacteria bacterium]